MRLLTLACSGAHVPAPSPSAARVARASCGLTCDEHAAIRRKYCWARLFRSNEQIEVVEACVVQANVNVVAVESARRKASHVNGATIAQATPQNVFARAKSGRRRQIQEARADECCSTDNSNVCNAARSGQPGRACQKERAA